jgi:hypothetical protein
VSRVCSLPARLALGRSGGDQGASRREGFVGRRSEIIRAFKRRLDFRPRAVSAALGTVLSAGFAGLVNHAFSGPWVAWGSATILALLLSILVLELMSVRPGDDDFRRRFHCWNEHLAAIDSNSLGTDRFDVGAELTRMSETLREMTQTFVAASLWVPSRSDEGILRWSLAEWPDHTPLERSAYEVRLGDSWVAHFQRLRGSDLVFGMENLASMNSPGADLFALRHHGFKAIMCAPIGPMLKAASTEQQARSCLIVVAKRAHVFDELEFACVREMARTLRIHQRIGMGEPPG